MITALLIDDVGGQRDALREALAIRGGILLDGPTVPGPDEVDIVVIGDPPGLSKVREVRASHPSLPIAFVATSPQGVRETSKLVRELGIALVESQPIEPAAFARQLLAVAGRRHVPAPVRTDFATELASLRAGFTTRLSDKLAELAAAIAASRVSSDHLRTARLMAHRLSGSAGSYGHPTLGAMLATLEHELGVSSDAQVDAMLEAARAYVREVQP